MEYKIAILCIGYNRPDDFARLLSSVGRATYDDRVDLIISVDNSGKDDVERVAEGFCWEYGAKKIYTYEQRLGLKKHILSCGRFLDEYDALIVLEDDISVAIGFYQYAKETVAKYYYDDNIAGISLYNPPLNFGTLLPFVPAKNEFDVYFLQLAQSWGQIWMKRQWKQFEAWLSKNSNISFSEDETPSHICSWPSASSWLKYHIEYCIKANKYFVIPYYSLTTNYSSVGTHATVASLRFQTNMLLGPKTNYILPDFGDENVIKYDAFFERSLPDDSDLTVDLYGFKTNYKTRKLLTTKRLNFKITESFGRVLIPHEQNYIQREKGRDIFLYDLNERVKNVFPPDDPNKNDNYFYKIDLGFVTSKKYLLGAIKCKLNNLLRKGRK